MTHKDLEVYNKSMDLAVKLYKATERFPKDEQFGLTSQMRRYVWYQYLQTYQKATEEAVQQI